MVAFANIATNNPGHQPRELVLTAYYDAASTTAERDYTGASPIVYEDLLFTGATRSLTLARLRREVRNNPYLAGLVNKYPEAVGFSNLRCRTSSRDYNSAIDAWWYRYAKRATTAGDSLRTMEEIILRELLVAGEVFLILMVSGKVQVIPSEFCGSDWQLKDGSEINGVQYNGYGRPLAYRFGRLNPFGTVDFSEENSTVVESKYVIHMYHKDRVLMGRGLPWLLPSIQSARDLYEITRSKTKQIKDVNNISGTITKPGASNGLPGYAFPGYDPVTTNEPTAETGDAPADAKPKGTAKIVLKSGTFIGLEPGEKLEPLMSKYEAADYKELIMILLHAISSPVGLPVELWFSGLGDVNYSGFKGLGAQWKSRRGYVIAMLEDRYLNQLFFWRVSKARLIGEVPENPDQDDDLVEWAWKRTAVLDDEKQAKANKTRIDSGESTLADVWEESGQFVEEVLAARRQLYIKALIASGELSPDADTSTVKVPLSFLLANQVPGAEPVAGTQPVLTDA
jgi:capsid protein